MSCFVILFLYTRSHAEIGLLGQGAVCSLPKRKPSVKILILSVALIGNLSAQVPTGMIAGVVRDPSGAAIAGAQLTVVSRDTNLARRATTSEHGDYSFSALVPGEYKVAVQANQFPRMDLTASVQAGGTTTEEVERRPVDVKDPST